MQNIKDFITDDDIKELKKLLLRKQGVESDPHFKELEIFHNQSATPIDTLEIRSNYNIKTNKKIKLRLNVRDEKLRLMEIYLLVEGEGTGSMIIDYLIDIAKRSHFKQFEIHNVQHDNIDWKASNLGMRQEGYHHDGSYYYNYFLDLD